MAIRLVLVCKEGPARQAYLRETNSIGIEVDAVETYGDLFKAMITHAYQGVMIDLVTSIKASREEKGIVQEILDVFPVIQLKWHPETNNIRTMSSGMTLNKSTLAHFAARECQPFQPRAIRLNVRKCMNFNVLMSREQAMDQVHTERSVTINASRRGCFLYSSQDWSNTSEVWFVINELTHKTPILGEIRWRQPWGKTMAVPGVGVNIKKVIPQQLSELIEKYFL